MSALDFGSSQRAATASASAGDAAYAQLPMRFERNRGQTDARARFITRGPGYTLFLTKNEAVYSLAGRSRNGDARQDVVRMRFDTSASASLSAGKRLPGVTNYLRGAAARAT